MNHPIPTRMVRLPLQNGLFLTILLFLCIPPLFAASFQPSDEVRLTRDTPLLFLNKPIRQGVTGESFKVLAVKTDQKLVFLSAKDNAGKDIAVSVSENALELVPPDLSKVHADVVAAVDHKQFAEAKRAVDHALRAKPDDPNLRSVGTAVDLAAKAAAELNLALGKQTVVEADLKRRRRNADVTDRTNPLDPNDNSGRQQAQQMRGEADRIARETSQAVATAESNYRAAVSALSSISKEIHPGENNSGDVQPGLPETASQAKRRQDEAARSEHDTEERRQRSYDEIKLWTGDEAITPPGITLLEPTYDQTIEFINGKLKFSGDTVFFGKRAQKLIVESARDLTLIEPRDINPSVKCGSYGDQIGNHFYVYIETTNNRDSIRTFYKSGRAPDVGHRLVLKCEDKLDAEKLATAISHLAHMFGARRELF